ncbi:MAG: carbohydrate kinase family protein [Puniceicoccales bacterium]
MKPTESKPKPEAGHRPLLAVGTFVVDYHKVINHYPNERSSSKVYREVVSNGGAPLNLLVNLANMGVDFPLVAAGKVGKDLDGTFIRDLCQEKDIDTSQLAADDTASTGYTDVYTVEKTGRHTCFHFSGVGDSLRRRDVKIDAVKPKMLFLGSLGALGRMDEFNEEYHRPGSAQLIRDARKKGITTIVELAPFDHETSLHNYATTIAEAEYLIVSDRTLESITSMSLYTENQFDPELARLAAQAIFDAGLRKALIIHAGIAATYVGADGSFHQQVGSFLPCDQRAGSAGVDHAFCAGFLEGLYHEKPLPLCLEQGLAVAACCRRDITPSGGISSLKDCIESYSKLSLAKT